MQKLGSEKKPRASKIVFLIAIVLVSLIFGSFLTISIPKKAENRNCFDQNQLLDGNFEQISQVSKRASSNVWAHASENEYVKIGGKPIGISVDAKGLIVVDTCLVETANGKQNPLGECNVQKGDVLKSVNGNEATSIFQLKKLLDDSVGRVSVLFERGNYQFYCEVEPALDVTGSKKLGLILKEDVGGVGTLTFVTTDNRFGALGHYIYDTESSLGDQLQSGEIFNTSIDDVIKGEKGQAGGLVADVNRLTKQIGKIDANTNIGLYGDYNAEYEGDLYKIATKGEAKLGHAQVLTTIEGDTPKFYDIDVVKVVAQNSIAEKGMVILVKDKELLDRTGGIVQGMSGSPIVQDGVLIGAVTHVFLQDPTRGYAVHSRFMYEMAQKTNKTSNLTTQNNISTLVA